MTHVMVWRGTGQEDGLAGFWHHGVRLSDGSVVHYGGMDGVKTLRDAVVLRTEPSEFAGEDGRRVHEVTHANALSLEEAERRALEMVGRASYDLLGDNCETVARLCVLGEHRSCQAQGALIGVAGALVALASGGGLAGAALVALAAHKMWDRSGNRSRHRAPPDDNEDGGASR